MLNTAEVVMRNTITRFPLPTSCTFFSIIYVNVYFEIKVFRLKFHDLILVCHRKQCFYIKRGTLFYSLHITYTQLTSIFEYTTMGKTKAAYRCSCGRKFHSCRALNNHLNQPRNKQGHKRIEETSNVEESAIPDVEMQDAPGVEMQQNGKHQLLKHKPKIFTC